MSDTTQGDNTPNDAELFSEATNASTLEKFENPPLHEEPKLAPAPAPQPEPKPSDAPKPPAEDPAGPVPPGRLREEAEARRRAERERDELQRQIVAMSRPQPPKPDQPKPLDIFENPQGFVRQELAPYLDQIRNDFQNQREAMSLNFSIDRHGGETVHAARQALEQGMARGDQTAWSTYNRAMQSHDPYGVIVSAFREREQLREIGGDLEAYRKRVLEEALADPEYRKRAVEAARSQANGGTYRPAGSAAPSRSAASPSLGDIGASGGETAPVEMSDEELFRAATRAKRR